MIIRLERIPQPGETILGGQFLSAAGGKGANQAVGAARAGGRVTFVARVGRDSLADQAIRGWREDGIIVKHVVRDATAPSGVALIFVAKDGENSIAVASGANGKFSVADVKAAHAAFAAADVCVMQLETPLASVEAAANLAFKLGVTVILNPAPARALPARLLKKISILTPNETEAALLTGIAVVDVASAKKAAEKLRADGVGIVVLTLGARGALVADERGTRMVPGFKVKAVDTTAAGDVFNGALAVALAEGKDLDDAVRFANAAAALSVTKPGAQPSAPRRLEIDRLARSAR
jgi:ribokinase